MEYTELLSEESIRIVLKNLRRKNKWYHFLIKEDEDEHFIEIMFFSYDPKKFTEYKIELHNLNRFFFEVRDWDVFNQIAIEKTSIKHDIIQLKYIKPEIQIEKVWLNECFFTFLRSITL